MTEIEIENFQAIRKLKLKVEGFTVLTGKTNIGKSSVVRAVGLIHQPPARTDCHPGTQRIRVALSNSEHHVERLS